jgi:hypothetical protein
VCTRARTARPRRLVFPAVCVFVRPQSARRATIIDKLGNTPLHANAIAASPRTSVRTWLPLPHTFHAYTYVGVYDTATRTTSFICTRLIRVQLLLSVRRLPVAQTRYKCTKSGSGYLRNVVGCTSERGSVLMYVCTHEDVATLAQLTDKRATRAA